MDPGADSGKFKAPSLRDVGARVWFMHDSRFDGLSAVIIDVLQLNPLGGHLFVFRCKGGDKIKALYWDRNGLATW